METNDQNNISSVPDEQKDHPLWSIITSGAQMDWKQIEIMYTLRAVSYKDPPSVMLYVDSE